MEFGVSLWARQGVHGFVMGEVGGVECEGVGDGTVDAHAGALANNLRGVDQVFEGRLHTTRPGSAHDTGSDECQGNMRASWKCTRFPITCVGVSQHSRGCVHIPHRCTRCPTIFASYRRALSLFLLLGHRGWRFLVSEVPHALYTGPMPMAL